MIDVGIDAGSRTIKAVLFDAEGQKIVASGVVDQGIDQEALAQQLFQRLLEQSGLRREQVRGIVATGYGRKLIALADTTVTEITCQARGVRHVVPEAATIIDIGGQDSKLVRLAGNGRVTDFVMNDRCAAGTGRFLEVVATRLGVKLSSLGKLAADSQQVAIISSMCVVFAETEIVGLLASGIAPADIAAGVQTAVATRVAAMAGREVQLPVVFAGGVALIPGMDAALHKALGKHVEIAPMPQMTAAVGAALLAGNKC